MHCTEAASLPRKTSRPGGSKFTDGKFSKVAIRFERKPGKTAQGWVNDQIFTSIHALLSQKYGKPKEMHDGDHRQTDWNFPDALAPGASKSINFYYRWFGDDPRIVLTYSDNRFPNARPPPPPQNPKQDV